MTDIYYALTSIGWGRGSTLVEAHKNYVDAQHRNFPHLTDDELRESWGFIWQAPADTTGFNHGVEGLYWTFDDKDGELADPGQRVAYVGNVPDQFRTLAEVTA